MTNKYRVSKIVLAVVLLVTLIVTPPVYAYLFTAEIAITNSSTSSWGMLPIITISNNSYMASNGFMAVSGNDTRVQDANGNDELFMITDNKTLTAVAASPQSQSNLRLTTGNDAWTTQSIITGYGGYIEAGDDADLEWGNSGNTSFAGYFNPDSTGYLINKAGALPVKGNGDGTLTVAKVNTDSFTTDTWTDVGTKILVTGGKLTYEAESSATDTRCYKDFGLIDDTTWRIEFTFNNSVTTPTTAYFVFGMFSALGNFNGFAGDGIMVGMASNTPSVYIYRFDGGVGAASAQITIADAVTYYVTLERNSAILATLSVYTDAAHTTPIAGSPVTMAIPATITNLRYAQASNANLNTGAANEIIGWIDDLDLNDVILTTSAISEGYHVITPYLSGGFIGMQVDDNAPETIAYAGSINNNANPWIYCTDNIMSYMDSIELSVSGVRQLYFAPNTMIIGDNLPDREATGGDNDGTITWGSNPEGITVTIGSLIPGEQPASGATIAQPAPNVLPSNSGGTNWFADPNIAELQANPFYMVIKYTSETGGLSTFTETQVWRFFGIWFVLILTAAAVIIVRGHLLVASFACCASIWFMVHLTIFPMVVLIALIPVLLVGLVMERSPSV
jgi:hypothetical protein